MKLCSSLIIFIASALSAAELTLSGEWSGTWTDSRPEYGKSGGTFTCVAKAKEAGIWTCTFALGKGRAWTLDLKGSPDKQRLVFGGVANLGEVQGLYTWKGELNGDTFTGEYDGPGEKGTFVLKRNAAATQPRE